MALIEALGESVVVFVLLPSYPPEVFLFLLGGLLLWQTSRYKGDEEYDECSLFRYLVAVFSFVALVLILTFYFLSDDVELIGTKFFLSCFTLLGSTATGSFWSFKFERKLFKLLDAKERRKGSEEEEDDEEESSMVAYTDYLLQEDEELSKQKTRWRISESLPVCVLCMCELFYFFVVFLYLNFVVCYIWHIIIVLSFSV